MAKKKTHSNDKIIKHVVWEPNSVERFPSILALDTATSCGWAWTNGIELMSGTWDLSDKSDERHMKFIKINAHLRNIQKNHGLDQVAFEAVRFAGGGNMGRAIICQSELQGNIKHYCDIYEIPYHGYSSTEIKKFATGKGTAKKPEMIAAATDKFGFTPETDDEADALFILDKFVNDFFL